MVNKARTNAFGAGTVSVSKINPSTNILYPKITSIVYVGNKVSTTAIGGETIIINGTNFNSGCYVFVDKTRSNVVTFISSIRISFTAPAMSSGSYTLYVYNPDGATAIYVPGILYA
jgi:hypothetical protein